MVSNNSVLSFFRPEMSRILFPTQANVWSKCMDNCLKYRGARAPSFTDQAGMERILTWTYNTTTDPATGTYHADAYGLAFWIPFRLYYSWVLMNIQIKPIDKILNDHYKIL